MRKLLKYMKGYGKECVIAPLFKLLEASFELLIPLVVAAIVDTGIGTGDRGYVVQMVLVMVLLGLIGLACAMWCCSTFWAFPTRRLIRLVLPP